MEGLEVTTVSFEKDVSARDIDMIVKLKDINSLTFRLK